MIFFKYNGVYPEQRGKILSMKKLFLILLFTMPVYADFKGVVTRVVDGDTVIINDVRVRLDAIDAPEIKQHYGAEAKAALTELILYKSVYVKDNGYDRYKRVLGVIYYDGINVNRWLVANGFAWAYRIKGKTKDKSLLIIEQQARNSALGLWSSNYIPPWEYRKK